MIRSRFSGSVLVFGLGGQLKGLFLRGPFWFIHRSGGIRGHHRGQSEQDRFVRYVE